MSGSVENDGEIQFNTDLDADAELEEMRRQVESLQEDFQLKTLQANTAKEEGTRRTASAVGALAAGGNSSKCNPSIFVGGFDSRTTEEDLRVFFAACGTVVRLTMLKDRHTGQPKGTAYIEFESQDQACGAILKDGQSFHGKPLKVAPKRDNIPAFQRGMTGGRGGRGMGRGGAAMAASQQMAAVAMMASMMSGGMNFNPYGASRGHGRGRGRGIH